MSQNYPDQSDTVSAVNRRIIQLTGIKADHRRKKKRNLEKEIEEAEKGGEEKAAITQ